MHANLRGCTKTLEVKKSKPGGVKERGKLGQLWSSQDGNQKGDGSDTFPWYPPEAEQREWAIGLQ
jgi:hypothetical protein